MTKINPLLSDFQAVEKKVLVIKDRAKAFYFQVLLGQHVCPACGLELEMIGPSECACPRGHRIDPTTQFQKSTCCGARLVKQLYHYACVHCGRSEASRFLFDERLFDAGYFRLRMAEHRARVRERKESRCKALVESRSGVYELLDAPSLENLPGLLDDLEAFIGQPCVDRVPSIEELRDAFDLAGCYEHISSLLGWSPVRFSDIPCFQQDDRLDKVRRFMTLLFMEQDQVVRLSQYGSDIQIERVWHEADQ